MPNVIPNAARDESPGVIAAVRAVIRNSGRFLAIRHATGGDVLWDLPGGDVRHGESPYDTLQREVKSCVGMDVTDIQPLGIWWFFRRERVQVVCTTFSCRPRNRKVRIEAGPDKGNIIEARWVSRKEFMSDFFRASHGSLKRLISDM